MKTTNIFYRALCLVLMALCSVFASGQSTNTFNPSLPQLPYLSPEAASLGKYGEIPVSEYTGVPEISVPLHTVRIGELELPLSLTYHASGIKVAQEATWVGLGWDLQAGGCINQIVSGRLDITPNTPWNYWENVYSKYTQPFLTTGDNYCWAGSVANADADFPMSLYQDMAYGLGEPDIYQAYFCGHSLKFFIHPQTGLPVIVGEDMLKYRVEPLNSYRNSWKITDGEGIEYYFETNGAEQVVASGSNDHISSWFLTRMVHPQKGEIVLEYEENSQQMVLLPTLLQQEYSAEFAENVLNYNSSVGGGYPNVENEEQLVYADNRVRKKYLSAISTELERIEFYKSAREDVEGYSRKLDSLVVSNYKGTVVKRVSFDYSYKSGEYVGGDFLKDKGNYNITSYHYKRLFLDSLSVNDQHYTFGYNSTSLPYKVSCAVDFWGYYNGCNNTDMLCAANLKELDSNPDAVILGSANRYADPDKMKAGMLEKIVYPTKGYTVFEYESNTFIDNGTWCPKVSQVSVSNTVNRVQAMACKTTQAENNKPLVLEKDTKVTVEFVVSSPYYTCTDLTAAYATLMSVDGAGESYRYSIPLDQLSSLSDAHSYTLTETFILPAGAYLLVCSYPSDKYNPSGTDYSSLTQLSVTYKAHSVSSVFDGISYGGGLRVSSISHYESDGSLLREQKYDYTNKDGATSGKLLLPLPKVMRRDIYTGISTNNSTVTSYALDKWYKYTLSSAVRLPVITSLHGTNVGYSRVIVKDVGNNVMNGETVTTYHNEPSTNWYNEIYLFDNYRNGKMIDCTIKDKQSRIVQKHEWKYSPVKSSSMINSYAMDVAPGIVDSPFWALLPLMRYQVYGYPFITEWNKLQEETVTDYFYENGDTTQISHVTQYEYNVNNHRPSSITRTTSVSDEILKTEIKYADNFSGTAAFDSLLAKNMVNLPVETIEYRNNTVLSRSKNEYTLFNGKPYLSSLKWAKGNNAYETRMQYTKYDTDGNLLEYVRPDGVTVSQLWSYKNQYPIVQVEGMSYSTMTSVLGSGYVTNINTGIEGINQLKSIYNLLSSGLVSAQSYSPLIGISGSIDSEGNLYRYTYDTYGRLTQISDINNSVINQFEYNYK